MAAKPTLYRKRLIPNECIRLDKDEILLRREDLLVTRWHTIRPKKELDHGVSCFLLNKGWKISRFLTREDQLICWYCDIIDWTHDPDTDTYIFTDLLADVLLTQPQLCLCMRRLNALLEEIYAGNLLPPLAPYWP